MPLAFWSVSLAVGIAIALLGGLASAAAMALAATIVAAGLAACILTPARVLGGAVLWLGVGVGAGTRALVVPALPPALEAAVAGQDPVRVTARVVHGPEIATRGARLIVDVDSFAGSPRAGAPADSIPARARVALSVVSGWRDGADESDPDLAPGQRIRFTARLRPLRGLANPGLPDPTLASRAGGVDLLAGVGDPSALAALPGDDASPLAWARARAFRARVAMRGAIRATLSGDAAAFLQTAVLGDRRGVDEQVEAGFRAAGATHVLSVSGLHLAAVAVIFLVGLRRLLVLVPVLPLYVDPRAAAALLALPAVGFFVLLTGEAVATQRSALMIAVALTGFLVDRPASAPATLGAATVILLLGSPLLLFDVSLQLSLASVAGIALLARVLGPRGPRATTAPRRLLMWLWRFGAATVSATAVTAPLGAHHFGEIAPAAPLGNLLLVPLVEMVVVPFGLAGAALAALSLPIGWLPLRIAGLAARLALAVAASFRAHAPVWLCRMPNTFETLALVAGAVLALAALGWRSDRLGHARRRWRVGLAAGAACAFAAAIASSGARSYARAADPDLRVTFLDVGQGDAALVEAPGGHTLLIDGGGSFDGAFDPGERVIEPLLRRRAIAALDLVALSHPHPDHLNGLMRIVQRFAVARLWTSGDDGRNPDYARLLALARARDVALPVPSPLTIGALAITPLGPWWEDRIAAPSGLSVNDASLVLRLDFAGRAALFPGDLEADGEGELVGRRTLGDRVAADLLKVPHHGSRTSSSPELIAAVAPALAVISLGWQNRFRFPSAEVVERYAASGTRVLRTDRDGAVTVRISPRGAMSVTCARGCPPDTPSR